MYLIHKSICDDPSAGEVTDTGKFDATIDAKKEAKKRRKKRQQDPTQNENPTQYLHLDVCL